MIEQVQVMQRHHGKPLVGVMAVLLGAAIATVHDSLPPFGLADVRGGFGLGVDQASWMPTIFLSAQAVSALLTPALSTAMGVRRLLTIGTIVLIASSAAVPLARNLDLLLSIQAVRGLAVGLYIPAMVPFVMRSLPSKWWVWGIAAYAFRFVFAQNISATCEALLIEDASWRWIFWMDIPLSLFLLPLIRFGMADERFGLDRLIQIAWSGAALAGFGAALLYAGLDQAERLDWLNSGTVISLLLSGLLLLCVFIVNERCVASPLIDLRIFRNINLLVPHLLISIYVFGGAATGFLVPNYFATIQGYRNEQIGDPLLWIALLQFLAIPGATLLARRFDGRLIFSGGLALMVAGAWLSTRLTHDWIGFDFFPSLCVQAVGLAASLVALINFTLSHVSPAQASTLGATLQTARLLGAEFAVVAMRRLIDVREKIDSNLIGLHVTPHATTSSQAFVNLQHRLLAHDVDVARTTEQAIGLVAKVVSREAHVLAYIDGFWFVALILTATLLIVPLILRRPVGFQFSVSKNM